MGYYSEGGMNPKAPNCGEILVTVRGFYFTFLPPHNWGYINKFTHIFYSIFASLLVP
ncbi:hypothetical protein M2273_002461 [Mucilaginibacter lappiensis]